MDEKRYRPIFAGFTEDGKKLVLYAKDGKEQDFHIQRPIDGQLWALSPGTNIDWVVDLENECTILTITSPEWTGTAKGTRSDLVNKPDLLV